MMMTKVHGLGNAALFFYFVFLSGHAEYWQVSSCSEVRHPARQGIRHKAMNM